MSLDLAEQIASKTADPENDPPFLAAWQADAVHRFHALAAANAAPAPFQIGADASSFQENLLEHIRTLAGGNQQAKPSAFFPGESLHLKSLFKLA